MARKQLIVGLSVLTIVIMGGLAAYVFLAQNKGGGSGGFSLGGHFELTDHQGRVRPTTSFGDKLLLIQFGYTFCPDVCPTELQKAATALDLLKEDRAKLQVVFVTLDPERDSAEILADYVGAFHEDIVGFTGNGDQILNVARLYRVYYAKTEPDEDGDYLLSHSAYSYLLDAKGRYLRHFTAEDGPEFIAEQIRSAL